MIVAERVLLGDKLQQNTFCRMIECYRTYPVRW